MPRVFISYTHDSVPHRERVGVFAEKIRTNLDGTGVEVVSDHVLPAGGPDEDFRRWSEQMADECEIVIPVFTSSYRKCWDGKHPKNVRSGGTNEATVVAARVNDAGGSINFLRVVIFTDADKNFIPKRLSNLKYFLEPDEDVELFKWIRRALRIKIVQSAQRLQELTWPPRYKAFLPDFANRDEEFNFFADTLCGANSCRATLICADSDHGKTKLVSQLYDYGRRAIGSDACCLVDFKARGTTDYLWDSLAVDLGVLIPGIAERSESKLRLSLRAAGRPILMAFDTFENAPTETQQFIERNILADMDHSPAVRVLLAGQKTGFPEPTKASWGVYAKRFDLGSIPDPEPWIHWARRRFPLVNAHMVRPIVLAAEGHPGSIANLLEKLGGYNRTQLQKAGMKC